MSCRFPVNGGAPREEVRTQGEGTSSQAPQAPRVVALDSGADVLRQVEAGQQLELRHLLAGPEGVGAQQKAVGAAGQERLAEGAVVPQGVGTGAGRQVAPEVRVRVE
jgi:hypothetical protein